MSAEQKKFPAKSRPKKAFSKPRMPATAPAVPFKESLFDSLGGDFALKLRKSVEDSQKKKIREAMADPKVQQAAKKFAKVPPPVKAAPAKVAPAKAAPTKAAPAKATGKKA